MELRVGPDGVDILVKVVPKSSRDRVAGLTGDRLKVCVAAAPEKGRANAAVVLTLAAWLGLPKSAITVVAGEKSPRKTVRVRGLEAAAIEARVHQL